MTLDNFLQFVKTIRMIYGHDIAKLVFEKNAVVLFPDFIDKDFFRAYDLTNTGTKIAVKES